ncbi:MAG TPA: PPC domain-containing protein [Pirellulaceae bacterium]
MSMAPGKTTEVSIEGTNLNGLLTAWTSFPSRVEMPPRDEKKDSDGKAGSCKLTLSPNVPVGIGGIVVATPGGASDVMYMMIDDMPTVFDSGKNHESREAQTLTLPTAVEGESDGTLADYYRLSLTRGQQLSVEVVAARLGQDFDAVIRVLDGAGNELLLADDDPATGADPRFVLTVPKDGNYLLEARDNRYKPGGRYRLRLGEFPLVSATLPPVVERDALTEIEFRGLTPISSPPSILTALDNGTANATFNFGFKPPGSQASGWAAPLLTDLPLAGTKPGPGESQTGVSQTTPGASLLPADHAAGVPCVFYGAIEASGERDVFSFNASKGKALRMTAISRSAGSPAIVALRVLSKEGKQLAESPVTESDEPVLSFIPPADGTYQLVVDELAGRFGSDFVYAVECELAPQFSLALKNDKNNRLRHGVPSGGAFYLDVQRQRSGYDGPIALAVESARPGWQLINAVIPAKANEVRMYIQPPVDFAPGELAMLRITGKTEQAGHSMSASMSTLVQLRAARPQTPYPPRWHDGFIVVSAQPPKPGFYNVTTKNTSVELPRGGGEAQLTLDFERTDAKFKDTPLVVIPVGLPPGVTADVKRNGNGPKETYDIRLKSTKDVAAGQHLFRYFAYAELAGQGRGVMSGDIVLNVIDKPEASGGGEKSP